MRKPGLQFLGPATDQITLDGVLFPGFSGRQSTIDGMKESGDKGEPLMLTDGMGRVYGKMVIVSIAENRSVFLDTGAARRIEFSITLQEYGEDAPGAESGPLSRLASQVGSSSTVFSIADAFVDPGSAFAATNWTSALSSLPFSETAVDAGFATGQLGAIAQILNDSGLVQTALDSLGFSALSAEQLTAWATQGINGEELRNAVVDGLAPYAAAIGIDSLRTASDSVIQVLGGADSSPLQTLIDNAGTIGGILKVDPSITEQVEAVIRLF